MPKWHVSFTEKWRFWQTWFIAVTTTIPTVWHAVAAYSRNLPTDQIIFYSAATFALCAVGAGFVIHVVDLVGSKIGDGLRAMSVARTLEGLARTGHGPATLQYVVQMWTRIEDPTSSAQAHADWQIGLRDIKECANRRFFTFENDANDAIHPGAHLRSRCHLLSTARFFRSLAWKGIDQILRQR